MNLDYTTIKNTSIWVLVGIAVVGLVLAIVIKKIIGKVITLAVAAVIIFFGWQQRSKVVDYANETMNNVRAEACALQPKFFGIQVTLPGC